jgi:hypothetical protein
VSENYLSSPGISINGLARVARYARRRYSDPKMLSEQGGDVSPKEKRIKERGKD